MHEKEIKANTVHLYQSAHRLVPGAVYWYGEDYLSFSDALDRTLQQIKSAPLKNKLEISLHLNRATLSSAQLEEWKKFYCAEKAQEYTSEQVLMKRQGYKFLWKCLFLLWLCLTGAYAFDQLKILGDYSQMLGRETFFFLGWVILWKPIEMIVFEPWSYKHQLRLIEKLKHATISTTTL
ncbi:MAG: hypothetical protein K0R51_228 [Cytophagaceae bacterium]|jgi:hypothetical protein|nr:hypothetical protein [Cytophagaceae bacterium]